MARQLFAPGYPKRCVEMFRVTAEYVEELRAEGYDLWTISLWENWLAKLPLLDEAIDSVSKAFDGVTLGTGIGLIEAYSMDGYVFREELTAERAQDEKERWQDIDVRELDEMGDTANAFFDTFGFIFHLPAFLLAELNDEFTFCQGVVHRLVAKRPSSNKWILFLDDAQRRSITSILEVVQHHPDYVGQSEQFRHSIARLTNPYDNGVQ